MRRVPNDRTAYSPTREIVPVDDPRVQALLAERFFRMMRVALAGAPLTPPVVLLVLWSSVANRLWLILWVACTAMSVANHLGTWLRMGPEHPKWQRAAIISLAQAGVLWGLLPLAASSEDMVFQVIIGQLVVGVVSASAVFASIIPACQAAFVVPAVLVGGVSNWLMTAGSARWSTTLFAGVVLFHMWLARHVRENEEQSARLTVQLEAAAMTDGLTGLSNREHFVELLETNLAEGRPGVVFLDLDGFKPVNDTLGHSTGDELLAVVAKRITRVVRPEDTVARLGGDEFTVLIADTTLAELGQLAERILHVVCQPVAIEGETVLLGVSAGVAVAEPNDTATDVLRAADAAQYRAKRAGGRQVSINNGSRINEG